MNEEWKRSSYCAGGECVEIADSGTQVQVRQSADPDGQILTFTRDEWDDFVAGVKAEDFN